MNTRKAQFFIITVVLVAGSLSLTVDVLEDFGGIAYQEVTGARTLSQFQSIERTVDDAWYNEDWRYRRQIEVTERADRGYEDVPIAVEVNTTDLIDDGKLQSDCSDLRATQQGRSLPIQFRQSECGEDDMAVWMLVDLEAGSKTSELYLYYGNDRVSPSAYETGLSFDNASDRIRNRMIQIGFGNISDVWGVTDLRRRDGPDITGDGIFLEKNTGVTSGKGYTIEERGPVYINFSIDSNWFMVFPENPVIRTNMTIKDSGSVPYYGNSTAILDTWFADTAFSKSISGSTTGSNNMSLKQVGANRSSGDGVLAALPVNVSGTGSIAVDLKYKFESTGDDRFMGFSTDNTAPPAPTITRWVDYWVGNQKPGQAAVEKRTFHPRVSLADTEQRGRFSPGIGWEEKKTIELSERNASILDGFPVNVTFNMGEMDVRDDCSDLIFAEDGRLRHYNITDQCDSRSYKEPADFAMRVPFEEGGGVLINDSTDTYQGRVVIENRSIDPAGRYAWQGGRFGLGMLFKENRTPDHDVFVSFNDTGIQMGGTSFGISFWFNMNGTIDEQPNFNEGGSDADENHQLYLFDHADQSPSLRVWNRSNGEYVLQGRYRDGTPSYHNITVEDPLMSDLDSGWHQVAMSYNSSGTNLSIFVDGQRVAFNDSISSSMGTTPPVYSIGRGFEGAIDEFKVYTRHLSADEIRDMYVQESTVSVRTDLGLLRTESDLDVYAEAPFFINESMGLSLTGGERAIDRSPVVTVSDIKRYDQLMGRLNALIESSGLANRVDMTVIDRCTDITFQTARLLLGKVVC